MALLTLQREISTRQRANSRRKKRFNGHFFLTFEIGKNRKRKLSIDRYFLVRAARQTPLPVRPRSSPAGTMTALDCLRSDLIAVTGSMDESLDIRY